MKRFDRLFCSSLASVLPVLATVAMVITAAMATIATVGAAAAAASPTAQQKMLFIYNGPEAPNDNRYTYHWRVLTAALEVTKNKYGPYELASADFMSESRQMIEINNPNGKLNTMVLDTSRNMEKNLLPVKIPIDKGLLGYRVFLIQAKNQERFNQISTLDELRKISIGQGFDWSDLEIFKAAGFPVVPGASYDGLFSMLMANRFDAFGRGVTEVLPELQQRRKRLPGMAIEKSILLYYPMPVYFWFPRTENGEARAKRVHEGMNLLIANGTLDKLFHEEFGPAIAALALKQRRLFKIDNPTLPPNQPFDDKRLWFDPLR